MARRSTEHRNGACPTKVALAKRLRREMTPAERELWERLRRKALGIRARPQHVIRGWVVDFYLPGALLVVEVDGDVHDLQANDDARREQALRDEGLSVLRVRNEEVLGDGAAVVDRIAALVRAHAARNGLTPR